MEYSKLIDHTCLKADATVADIEKLCEEARHYDFMTVCINPFFVPIAKQLLEGSSVKICTVIGFPLGASNPQVKAFEAAQAVADGADEIDMVQNITMAREHEWDYIEKEVALVKASIGSHVLKVILENCYLTDEEIAESAKAAQKGKADFVKTSTGFGKSGAKVHDVEIMRKAVGPAMGVKAAGGIHTKEEALAMITAGATRIGTSAGVAIMEEK
jgi:deoxyribose-phosphate aldolase